MTRHAATLVLPENRSHWEPILRSRIDRTSECWLYIGPKNDAGYGTIKIGGRSGHIYRAHRLIYELDVGPIPQGMQIDHRCHVRACVRPSHLQVATPQANSENRAGPHSTNKTSGIRGVSWKQANQAWVVQAAAHGVHHYGGLFKDIHEAERAAVALRNRIQANNLRDRTPQHGTNLAH